MCALMKLYGGAPLHDDSPNEGMEAVKRLGCWSTAYANRLGAGSVKTGTGRDRRERMVGIEWRRSGRGAVWLARLNGVQEVAGSNPVAPTLKGHSSGMMGVP